MVEKKNSPPYAFFCPKIWKIEGGGKFVGENLDGPKPLKIINKQLKNKHL